MQPCSFADIGARGSWAEGRSNWPGRTDQNRRDKFNDHAAEGNAPTSSHVVGLFRGTRYRVSGGCFDDISIQATADLAFQYLISRPSFRSRLE